MKLTAKKDRLFEGFSMTFSNELTISVQYGEGNYSTRNEKDEAISAEIAIWDNNGKWFDFGNDVVMGWVSPDEIADWINKVSKAKDINDIPNQ